VNFIKIRIAPNLLSSEPQPVYAEPSLATTADITALPFDDVETGDMEKILTPMKTLKKDRETKRQEMHL